MYKTKLLTIRFSNEIDNEEVPMLRGAVINAMEQADVLFHNHTEDDRLRYSYPLIQYKRINRKAAIVCLGEGTDAIGQFFAACNFDVTLGDRRIKLEVESVKAYQCLVQLWNHDFSYRIRRWLPLNKENYETYLKTEGLAERYAFLERMLTGNILSFAKGLGIHFNQDVKCKLTSISNPHPTFYKGVKMMSFDAEFRTNVSLPDYTGLGKGVSLGMGTVVRKYKNNDNFDDNNE